jgi:anti-anti-sigma factor
VENAHIDISHTGAGVTVVAVSGEIDLSAHDELSSAIVDAVQAKGTDQVIVDLSETAFMDSTGIKVLIRGHEAAAEAGVPYHVNGAQGPVRRVLEVTGVLSLLESPDDIGEGSLAGG